MLRSEQTREKERTSPVRRVAWVFAGGVFILTVPTAPLLAQQITEVIDSSGDGTNGLWRNCRRCAKSEKMEKGAPVRVRRVAAMRGGAKESARP